MEPGVALDHVAATADISIRLHQAVHKSMSLKYEPASEPLHISVK